jgi:hypothetical protein
MAAEQLLRAVGCHTVPSIEELVALVDDMTGQNPPEHPNHLGEPYNVTKFTGRRPPPLPFNFFEKEYTNKNGAVFIPWTGIQKVKPEFAALEAEYSEGIPNLATKPIGGRRRTKARKLRRNKTRRTGGGCGCSGARNVAPYPTGLWR